MAKIRDESNAKDDARLIEEQSRTSRRDVDAERRQEEQGGFSVGGRDNASPDGWNTSR